MHSNAFPLQTAHVIDTDKGKTTKREIKMLRAKRQFIKKKKKILFKKTQWRFI